ncbi:MAG: hypothetical protein LBE84_07005 [Planctomycetota bacterium]|jgi:hypothetical protein|nr:hypothetical protein [Planctomycetota bacterium]
MKIVIGIYRFLCALLFIAVSCAALALGLMALLDELEYLEMTPVETSIMRWRQEGAQK